MTRETTAISSSHHYTGREPGAYRLDASCSLHYDESNNTDNSNGNRIVTTMEELTAQAESMTKEEFQQFQRDQVADRSLADTFIAKMRHAIITQNDRGQFVQHRISPAVFTDDWVLKATHFVNTVMKAPPCTSTSLELEMVEKRKGFFVEGWLNVRAGDYSLPLVMFTKREDDSSLEACLNKILAAVYRVLMELFPSCTMNPRSLPTTRLLWAATTAKRRNKSSSSCCHQVVDTHVGDALDRIKTLKAKGATKVEIKTEMRRLRDLRKRERANNGVGSKNKKMVADDDEEAARVPCTNYREYKDDKELHVVTLATLVEPTYIGVSIDDGYDESKYNNNNNNRPRCCGIWGSLLLVYHNKKGNESVTTSWVWKGLLASLAVYFIYSQMRGAVVW